MRRTSGERVLDWGLIVPGGEDHGTAFVGAVQAVGQGHRVGDAVLPLEVEVGDLVIYSARSDTFAVGSGVVDVVDENSVLGVL